MKHEGLSQPAMTRMFVVLLCILPIMTLARYSNWNYGLAPLANFGTAFEARRLHELKSLVPEDQSERGYDGQFYVQIAMNPTIRRPDLRVACDSLAYRAQRIGMPIASYVLGLGQPRLIIQIYCAINFVAWVALLVWFLKQFGVTTVRHRQLAVALLWSTGTLVSMSRALTDFPSLCLCVFAIQSLASRPTTGGLLAIGALLTKETALLSLFSFASVKPFRLWSSAIRLGLIALPLVLWLAYVRYLVGGNTGGFQNFTWPILGWIEKLQLEWTSAWWRFPRIPFLEMLAPISIAIQTVYLLSHRRWESAWWRMGIGTAILSLFLSHHVWVENIAYSRVLLPMTFAFNMQLTTEGGKNHQWWYWLGNSCLLIRAVPGLLLWLIFERYSERGSDRIADPTN